MIDCHTIKGNTTDGVTRSIVFQWHHQDLNYVLTREVQANGDPVAAAVHYESALHRVLDELQKRGDGPKITCIARVLQDHVENSGPRHVASR